jgi:serine/threonine protein kinase
MAPEQNEGKMLFQTDVYSFGVVLFELLAGRVPFPLQDNGETSRNAVMISHLEAPVPNLMELRSRHLPQSWGDQNRSREMQVPGWLLAVIAKCLEKRPEKRFKDGVALHEAIISNHAYSIHSNEYNAAGIVLLQGENERLKSLLLQYQQTAFETGGLAALLPDSAKKSVAPHSVKAGKRPAWFYNSATNGLKPIFTGLIILFTCLGLYVGFSIFKRHEDGSKGIDTLVQAALIAEKQRLQDSIQRLHIKNIQDSIDNARRIETVKQTIAEVKREEERKLELVKAEKKQRKPFLGIRFRKR